MRIEDHAIRFEPGDICTDFCLWDYGPLTDPHDHWRSETILLASFARAGVLDEGRRLMDLCRGAFGPFRSVWGIKEFDGQMSWEFYFYDYERLERSRSMTRLLDALKPEFPCALAPPENRQYFMFSISLDASTLAGGPIKEIDVYIGNPGSTVSSGICYLLTEAGMRLKNFYFFFDTGTEREQAMRKLTTSAHFDEGEVWPADLAWPEMMDCKTVVVANKAINDSLYFSRITTERLIWFLRRVGFDPDLASSISDNSAKFDHLYFDAGYDFIIRDKQSYVAKSSFYGYF